MTQKSKEPSSGTRKRGRPRKKATPNAMLKHLANKIEQDISSKQNAVYCFVLPRFVSQADEVLKFLGVPIADESRQFFFKLLGEGYEYEELINKLVNKYRDDIEATLVGDLISSLNTKDDNDVKSDND